MGHGRDPDRRAAAVAAWDELPDYVSANAAEAGFVDLCGLVTERGVGIEAGLWSRADAETLIESGVRPLRVLVETGGADPVQAAAAISGALVAGGVTAPQLHHGHNQDTWAVIDAALPMGHDIRIGLEDTTVLPDGSTARDNAALVAAARERISGSSASAPPRPSQGQR